MHQEVANKQDYQEDRQPIHQQLALTKIYGRQDGCAILQVVPNEMIQEVLQQELKAVQQTGVQTCELNQGASANIQLKALPWNQH